MCVRVNDAAPRLVSATWGILPRGFNFQRLMVTSGFTKRPNINRGVVWPFQKKKNPFISFFSKAAVPPRPPLPDAGQKQRQRSL